MSTPVLVGELNLDAPLPDLEPGHRYRHARLLVRLGGRPVGELELPLSGLVRSARLAELAWGLVEQRGTPHNAGRTDTLPPVTVVIATRERPESLLRCLTSLSTMDYPSFDVVVVDSAPRTMGTANILAEQHDWPFALRYGKVDRPGLALAHNTALPLITGEIVAITDDDVEVDRNWLAALAGAFTEFGATCVTGLILPAELETPAQLLVERAGGFSRGFTRRVFHRDTPPPDPLFPFTAGRFGSGANMAFRAEWLAGHGGFDPATGAGSTARGGDDLSAFLEVILDGGTLVYEPAAIVRHWHRREYAALRRQAYGYGVGLGAYLTAAVWARPALLASMLRRLVPAARHLLGGGSVRNSGRAPGFPRELVWRELAGLLAGPFAYTVSRWRCRDRPRAVPR